MGRTFFQAWRPVRVSATVPLVAVIRLDAIAAARSCRRGIVIGDAIRHWTIMEERRLSRRRQIHLQRVIEECERWDPITEYLAEAFREPLED